MENSFKFNSLQSTIEDLNLSMYPEEIQEQFYEYISTVPYIKNLVSKDRPRAKDLPRDEEGKIEIDLTNPHIVEDTDYFRQAALNFQKFGKYTNLRPNPNPNSEFGKWFREEVRRCYYGLVRESDGEWITGDYYFFLNYCPIMKVKKIKGNVGTRVFDFPDFLEGQYLKYHYINKARNNGKHGTEMAKRGAGKSFTLAALLAKRFIFGESPESNTRTESFCASYRKDYLIDDGILNKFEAYIHFCSENTEFPSRRRVKDSLNEMQWRAGYKDLKTGTTKGTLNEVIGVSVKDSEGKLRGKRGALIGLEEIGSFPNLLGLYGTLRPSMEDGDMVFGMIFGQGCVCAGTKVVKPNGEIINIEDVNVGDKLLGYNGTHTTTEDITWKQPIGYKNCVKIKTEKANVLECSDDHPILALNKDRFGHSLGTCSFYRANELKIGDTLLMPKYISKFGEVHEPNAFLLGSLFGDGSYTKGSCVTLSITTEEEYEYYNNNYNIGINKLSKGNNKYAQIYFRGLHPLLKKYGMDNQSFERKTFPNNIFDWDKASVSAFLSGYFNADGNVQIVKDKHISIKLTCKYENPLIQTKSLLTKFGISSHIYKERKKERVLKSNTNNKEYVMPASECYVLYISNSVDIIEFRNSMKFLIKEKQLRLDSYIPTSTRGAVSNLKFTLRDNGKGIHLLGSTFDDLQCVTIKSIEDIGIRRIYNMTADTTHTYLSNGFISSNTAGDKDSDFTAAQSIMYAPKGFNMQDIPNVYDKVGTAAADFVYFFPAYLNRNGCYNKDGVSDVTKALLEVLVNRYNVKYNNPDFTVVTKTISEHPIVPQEAVLRSRGNMFPVSSLQERLNQLKNNPNEYDDVYVGTLVLNSKGKVEFKPTSDNPIRKFPTDDNKVKGAIEIFQMPKTNKDGEVVSNRYIVGHDPVDQDTSNTMSLTSTFVFDLYTDSIVAEYTGRQEYAEENYEIVRLLCMFYNAKCLYEAHPYSQIVNTPDGIKLWKDIKVGDTLFSPTKGTVKVTNIPVDEYMKIYKVILADGREVYASDNHIWTIYKGTSKKSIEMTTAQMMETGLKNKHNQHLYYISEHSGVEYEYKKVLIDPYTMGLILSEGSLRGGHCGKNYVQISSSEEDMLFYKNNIPYKCSHIGKKGYSWHLYINECKNIMVKYGLYNIDSHNKFIPKEYLHSNRVQRMELLKGLMDGDGHASCKGSSIFITCSKQLADDVMSLCRSLGIKSWLQTSRPGVFRVAIASEYKIFKLPRKVVNQHVYNPYTKGSKASALLYKTAIANIEYSHEEMGKCVTVDSEDGLYLIGDYVVTHNCNKKGMFAYFSKMNSLYLLADTPEYLRDKQLIKYSSFGNNAKGVNANMAINNYANELIKDWLLKPTTITIKENGEDKEITMPSLYRIRNVALIQELIAFNPDINVDRVRALGMVMLYREEKMILFQGNINGEKESLYLKNYLGNDPFFTNNYDNRFMQ